MKEKRFTLKTKSGCWRVLALLLAVILVSSFLAALVSSNFGKVKISHLSFDTRGGVMDADLFIPAGTSDSDKLPAVVTIHGGGVVKNVMKLFAEELSRRGFVVLNINVYGSGLSEQPPSDDAGQGADGFDIFAAPLQGALDAVEYLRSLRYVDETRIGIAGHSMGSRRAGLAAIYDCGYLSANDMLINMLNETFGLEFTREEIDEDADALAEKYLDPSQMDYYLSLKGDIEEYYNSRIKAACLIGSNANLINPVQTVEVAGYEVQRNCQVNIGVINGTYDTSYYGFLQEENTKAAWYTQGEDGVAESWYLLDDVNQSSELAGGFDEISVLSNEALSEAVDNRATRICLINPETHSKNFFSNMTTSDVVKYFEQTLKYNGGELGASDAKPIDTSSNIWYWRAIFNGIAMISMLAMIFPIVGILTREKAFSSCVATAVKRPEFDKKKFWIFSAATVVFTFIAIYWANAKGMSMMPITWFFPLAGTSQIAMLFVWLLAASSIIMLVCYAFIAKSKGTAKPFAVLNLGMGLKNIIKSILIAFITVGICWLSMQLIIYLFNQDYRFWMMSFTEMKAEHWGVALRYAIYLLPVFLLTAATTNYTIRSDMPQWKDTLISVVIGSAGVWICCLINIVMAKISFDGTLFSSFICSYSMLLFVPATVYISRKTYNMTQSIWLGASINSLLLAWSLVSSNGMCELYNGQNFFSIVLGV